MVPREQAVLMEATLNSLFVSHLDLHCSSFESQGNVCSSTPKQEDVVMLRSP